MDHTLPLPQYDRSGGRVMVTSGFGPRWGRLHGGVDLGTTDGIELGTPVLAPCAGRVASVGVQAGTGAGRWLWFLGDHGCRHKFFHLNRWTVTSGHVEQGQQIAEVGKSGTTDPHLHWERHIASWSNPIDHTVEVRQLIDRRQFAGLAIAGEASPPVQEDDMITAEQMDQLATVVATRVANADGRGLPQNLTQVLLDVAEVRSAVAALPAQFDELLYNTTGQGGRKDNLTQVGLTLATVLTAVRSGSSIPVDVEALAAELGGMLGDEVAAALGRRLAA